MAEDDYKEVMRKYIEVVKRMAFEAPLEQALDDLKVMSQATAMISDRVALRVAKSLNPNDKEAKRARVKSKGSNKRNGIKPFPSVQPTQPPKPQTSEPPNTTATNMSDANKSKQDYAQSLKPMQPIKPIGSI
jgi:hypothetical protein